MSNSISKTQDGQAVLYDETKGTFTRFTHRAYAGFYNAGEFSKHSRMKTPEEVGEMTGDDAFVSRPIQNHSAYFRSCAGAFRSCTLAEKREEAIKPSNKEGGSERRLSKFAILQRGQQTPNFDGPSKYQCLGGTHRHLFIPRTPLRVY